MTTQASGAIAISQIGNEVGIGTGSALDIAYLRSLLRSPPGTYNLSDFYSKAWFQRNVDGNCTNGNCYICNFTNGNCYFGLNGAPGPANGYYNCFVNCNCINCTTYNCSSALTNINCANCDGSVRLQDNCNCACTYNCGPGLFVNCNCDCNCNCSS